MPRTVHLPGKLAGRRRQGTTSPPATVPACSPPVILPESATAMSFLTPGNLIFLHDTLNNYQFLVDSGASLSILPHMSTAAPSGPTLVGTNGKQIPAWGFKQCFVVFSGVTLQFEFLLAAVATALLGMDFLAHFDLSIVPNKQQVLHAAKGRTFTKASTSSFMSPWDAHTVAAVAELPPQVQQLLAEFPTLLRPGTDTPQPLHGVSHHIDTGSATPVFARPRRLDPEKHAVAEAEFLALEKAGIIHLGRPPYIWSPRKMVPGAPAATTAA